MKIPFSIRFCVLSGISIALLNTGCEKQLSVVEKDQSQVVIVAGSGADDVKAAEELSRYIQKITGVKVGLTDESAVTAHAIYVGNTRASESLKTLLTRENTGYDGYLVSPVANGIAIVGCNGGTLHGVYDILYTWGCRFYMPGDSGEYIPKAEKLRLSLKKHMEKPGMDSRVFATLDNNYGGPFGGSFYNWLAKNKVGGLRYDHFHAFARLMPVDKYFASHPEYFALIKGKRVSSTACTTNPEVIKIIIEAVRNKFKNGDLSASVSLNDTDEACECEDCVAERKGFDASVNLFVLANKVASALEKDYPDRYIFLYGNYEFKGHLPEGTRIAKNVVPVWFPYSGGHSFEDKTCPVKKEKLTALHDWKLAGAKQTGVYDYLNLHEIEYPVTKSFDSQMKIVSNCNCIAGHFEIDNRSWVNNLSIYLAARLMWNPKENMEPVVSEYFRLVYGKAAPLMKKYYDVLEALAAAGNPDIHNQEAVYKNMTPDVQEKLRSVLEDAYAKAENDLFRKRVKAARVNFEQDVLVVNLENLKNRLIKSESDDDRKTVVAGEAKLEEYRAKYVGYNLPLSRVIGYSESESARPGKEYSILMSLPLFWKFNRDVKLIGDSNKWYSEDFDDTKWLPINTLKWWEDQGYPGYDGVAWYRLKFKLPEGIKNIKKLILHFGAVDDHAWVYINGKLAGSHAKGGLYWDEPFDISAGDFLYRDRENTIAVKVLDVSAKGGIFRKIWLVEPNGK
jgi:hypothetical protein